MDRRLFEFDSEGVNSDGKYMYCKVCLLQRYSTYIDKVRGTNAVRICSLGTPITPALANAIKSETAVRDDATLCTKKRTNEKQTVLRCNGYAQRPKHLMNAPHNEM